MSGSVLIVDDNFEFAENLGEILELDGLNVVVERDALRALERARELDLSLALLDIQLHRMDGVALHRALHEIHPNARYVLMTAYALPNDLQQAIEAGATVLQKPLDQAKLAELARGAATRS